MDSFAWASVSQTAGLAAGRAVSDALLPPMLGFQLPPPAGLEHFPVDSGLVERAARSSSFGAGNGTATAGMRLGHRSKVAAADVGNENTEADSELGGGGAHDATPSAEAAAAGDCSSGGAEPESKKRRYEDVLGADQAKASNVYTDSANGSERSKGAVGQKEHRPAAAAAAGKRKGKGAKEADEPYIHVRARSGQATNNHSLAERLRRERISERMKLLQDLVPGCSKVTGKAVMLDEIINYVQSLQRQVEFLSMKLATVNPRLGINIEGLLSKDLIRFSGAPSSAPIGFSFSQEMMPTLPLLSQSGMFQGGVHGVSNSNVFRTVMQDQLNEKDSFREHAPQMPRASDGSFHDPAQVAYRAVVGPEHLNIRPDQDGFHM